MKKAYMKPEIMFESFTLSTNIAAGCEYKNGLHARDYCGYSTRNGVVFTDGVVGDNGCQYIQPDNNDTLCYHVPNDSHNIFNS